MKGIRGYFRWVVRPQLLLSFVVLCLCVSALGTVARTTYPSLGTAAQSPQVKGQVLQPVPDCTLIPCMALTFDDGPDTSVTPRVLDILKAYQAKATLFVVGSRVEDREHILRRAHAEGHEIGNHSWMHPKLTALPPADVTMQVRQTQQAIMLAGVPSPHLFRPPYGAVDDAVMGHMDLTVVKWNIDPADWDTQDPVAIRNHLVANAKPGGIILLHDIYPSTAEGLSLALWELAPHYQFVTVSQLLNVGPGDHGLYNSRR